MEKRYQVFISSTFKDLQDERQAVLKAILELNHMPAGMELFPASDETAWQLIRDVIDASDYYVLIIAGRYGSTDETGIGYTEKEYDYAVSIKKPVVPLLYKDPNNLPREKTDTDESTWKKLKSFREKIEKKHTCVYWSSAEELKSKIIISLTSIIKRHPAVGWVRSDLVPQESTISEVLKLRNRIIELENEASQMNVRPPIGSEVLLQDDDEFEINYIYNFRWISSSEWKRFNAKIVLTWNQIFAAVAPSLINEAPDTMLKKVFIDHFVFVAKNSLSIINEKKAVVFSDIQIKDSDIDTCIVQLRALGLIKENKKQRSVKDTSTYWTLTPFGDTKMVQLRAIRKTTAKNEVEKQE